MTNWPDPLVRDIARRRSVIVLGSGVSRQANRAPGTPPPPGWKDLLIDANKSVPGGAKPHITEAINNGDYLHACEWLKVAYDSQWHDFIRSRLAKPKYSPADVHRKISEIDSRIVFSLNFDDIFERAAKDFYEGNCYVKQYYSNDVEEFLRGSGRYIVKIHGSLDELTRTIFTQGEYSSARISEAKFYNAFDSALLSHTFLFIGAGYNDPDINLILENQNFMYQSAHPHYFLAPTGLHEDRKRSLRMNRNLEVVEYDPADSEHSGFGAAIVELLDRVEGERENLQSTMDW
jgi:hypothetical protein